MPHAHSAAPLGAILAGGRSRRFGRPKALAEVGGRPIIERVRDAVVPAVTKAVLITDTPSLYSALGLPTRPDQQPGLGVLGGVYTALVWALEEGRPGALCVACDMPFLSTPLLVHLMESFMRTGSTIVAPEGAAQSRWEPLCSVYPVACLPEIESRITRRDLELAALLDASNAMPMSRADVRRFGDPDMVFFNVNTPDHYRDARRIAARDAEDARH